LLTIKLWDFYVCNCEKCSHIHRLSGRKRGYTSTKIKCTGMLNTFVLLNYRYVRGFWTDIQVANQWHNYYLWWRDGPVYHNENRKTTETPKISFTYVESLFTLACMCTDCIKSGKKILAARIYIYIYIYMK
jgi:hypothetical protein